MTTAGAMTEIVIRPGTCCRVSTGSMIPEGADAVVQVEDTDLLEHNASSKAGIEGTNF